ncbi:MAG: DUF2188 domain-containing protein [Chloroflexi bacterium]|nr:DUF2188 domain-containing protein [Chloroflexota bacterium]
MAKGKNQWVVKRDDGWGVRGEGNSRDTVIKSTQKDAIDAATEIARNQSSEVIIQGRDRKIRERNSYGNDPYPPKG